jgi:cytochrome c biogenesis protein CcmG/thiol:disulfide interchange protein DsbE
MKRSWIQGFILIALFTLWSPWASAAPLKAGDPAPDFSLTAMSGETVRLSAQQGNVTVIGLFHICEPCMQQALILQKIYQTRQAKGLKVIGINASGNSREDVQDYLNTFPAKVTFPYLLDPAKKITDLYSVRMTPNVYILDRKGIIRYKGSFTTQEMIEKVLASLE